MFSVLPLKLHCHRLAGRSFLALLKLEELALGKVEPVGNHVRGHGLDLGIQIADVAVVEAAAGLDLILGVTELILQLGEVLVGLQVWVVLETANKLLSVWESMFSAWALSAIPVAPMAAARAWVTFSSTPFSCSA